MESGSGYSSEAFLGEIIGCLKAHPVLGVGPTDPLEIEGELRGEIGLAVEDGGQFGLEDPELASGLGLERIGNRRR